MPADAYRDALRAGGYTARDDRRRQFTPSLHRGRWSSRRGPHAEVGRCPTPCTCSRTTSETWMDSTAASGALLTKNSYQPFVRDGRATDCRQPTAAEWLQIQSTTARG